MHRYLTATALATAITFVIGSAAKGEDWFTDCWLIDWLVIKIHYRNRTADALDILIPWRLYNTCMACATNFYSITIYILLPGTSHS